MKTFKVKMKFVGLAGEYTSEVIVRAKNAKSAETKAYSYVGDRSLVSMEVVVAA